MAVERYNHRTAESGWQKRWEEERAFEAKQGFDKPKY